MEITYQKREEELKKETDKRNKELQSINNILNKKYSDLDHNDLEIKNFEEVSSADIKDQLSMISLEEKEVLQDGGIIILDNTSKKSHIKNQAKQIVRSFNAECDFYLSNVNVRNVDTYRNRIVKSFETHNRIYKTDDVELSKELLELKLKKLNYVYSYQRKIEEEKELQKAAREQLIEEQKVEKELERKRKEIEKEERQFSQEVNKLMKYMQNSDNDAEKDLYLDKIRELEGKLSQLDTDKKDVENRATNTRAGYVYIISNIGSFGENIYKIGVTRRLEPMDRVKELSDASVPFEFDVHAMIFSDDAPALENTLHNHFRDKEINKINHRKEFFNVDLQEIEKIVKDKYNDTVRFTIEPRAEQYRESIKLSS
ncbi:DUF4041 domain-containing protein [Salinicoccus hispanicus]|uniref:DUF4041 domain-containing protein n=2 Tax=Salinicoccus hispanicus TaxID=157225 RepID=A0A6N8U2T2_9STAP|nr:DUF4041 domain-containing protein [Salinicoccus hispanicus]